MLPSRIWPAAAAVIGIAGLIFGAVWWMDYRSAQQRWSLFPHAMGCALDDADSSPGTPPPFLNPQGVDLKHLDGDRLMVSVRFEDPPLLMPREIEFPDGTSRLEPGTPSYSITVSTQELLARPVGKREGILITSPVASGMPWDGSKLTTGATFTAADIVPVTASARGRTIDIALNLADHDQLLKQTPFKPVVHVSAVMSGSQPGKLQYVGNFKCGWTTKVAAYDIPPQGLPPPAHAPSAREPESQPSPGFPPGSKPCPPKYGVTGAYTRSASGNDQTSCSFAEEVRISYADMGNPGSVQLIKVFSPATEKLYEVACQPAGRLIVCTGGTGAVVYLD